MKITKFRLFNLFMILLVLATKCTADRYDDYEVYTYVPEALILEEAEGLKLKNYIVDNQVEMNVKLSESGIYRLKIKDISGKLVSQERLRASMGNNILKTYTSSLPKSSYTLVLETEDGRELGSEVFAIKN